MNVLLPRDLAKLRFTDSADPSERLTKGIVKMA